MTKWQIQEAKTRFSELIDRACTPPPQIITRHGTDRAVMLSITDYRRLATSRPDFKAYPLGGPNVDEPCVERDVDEGRPDVF